MTPNQALSLADRQFELGTPPTVAARAASLSSDTPPLEDVAPAMRVAAAEIPARRPVRSQPIERLSLD